MSREGSETRRRILDAAWELLEAPEGGEVRMSDIARAAGVSRQAVYLHFPTRAELLVAVTRHVDAVKGVDARLAASRAAGSGEARLDAFVAAWGGYIPEIHGVARALIALGRTDAAARAAWEGRLAAIREGCHAAVAALARDGRLAPGQSVEEATDLLSAILSVHNWEHLTRVCGWSQELYLRRIGALARQAMLAPPPG
ncbi:TetR/AcrR family transcriptional regulator [Paralimibaculum aggregatum]|uniref:TetR/AcrR family transcriptional regulator n=1 Tax=Paralimibaculum aggregatum TaxID=3036245 RepID=A0ABQ6LMJ2_9RHOB|nr:TetR/AcrR family transcriptional regulator [Limibaculum sp. NKW23]GMG83514.1 TetR/AcrR family transcriptional regulator [Limibaculum sp. NKW23]